MSLLIKFALTVVGVVVISALLAPPIYWLVQGIGAEIFPWLQGVPFHRVFSRVLLICILLAVGLLLVTLRISNFRELGFKKNSRWAADFLWGLFIALVSVVILTAVYVYFGIYLIENVPIQGGSLLRIVGTTVVVSLLEEFVFRGMLYGLSRRVFSAFTSAVWTSIVFTALHFIRPSEASPQALDMWSGFREFARFFSGSPPFPVLPFAFATLFFIGLLLCWTVERTHSLALPIGLHAGWIFGIQTVNLFTKFQEASPIHLPWVAPNVVSGTLPVGIFAILAVCVTFVLCRGYLYGRSRKISSTECS